MDMLPRLFYKENEVESKSVWWFLDGSMRFHKTPLLERLWIELGPRCPIDVDDVKWVAKAIDRPVRWLYFKLLWNSEPTRMPKSLYMCKILATLTLSRKIIVDVPSSVSFPSLTKLKLLSVVYKDEDSHVRLLSSCPVLKHLEVVQRDGVNDNVRKFNVIVPSLLRLTYKNTIFLKKDDGTDGSLAIDTPALEYLDIFDCMGNSCSVEYMPRLAIAVIDVDFYPDGNFLTSLSSIKYLELTPDNTMVPWYNTINYSQLTRCSIELYHTDLCESLLVLLSNFPKLRVYMVECGSKIDYVPLLWNQPSSVPRCLSSHIETFEWEGYAGREDEKELIRYILENSNCLKTAGISPSSIFSGVEKQKILRTVADPEQNLIWNTIKISL